MSEFSRDDLDILTRWDTPTICNALEVVAPALVLLAVLFWAAIETLRIQSARLTPAVAAQRPA